MGESISCLLVLRGRVHGARPLGFCKTERSKVLAQRKQSDGQGFVSSQSCVYGMWGGFHPWQLETQSLPSDETTKERCHKLSLVYSRRPCGSVPFIPSCFCCISADTRTSWPARQCVSVCHGPTVSVSLYLSICIYMYVDM